MGEIVEVLRISKAFSVILLVILNFVLMITTLIIILTNLPHNEQTTEGSIFIDSGDQSNSLISEFGGEEFVCIGSCHCRSLGNEEEEIHDTKRRSHSSSMSLTKGFIFLVSALISIVAIDLAKEYFSKKCNEYFKRTCYTSKIHSEVENCENLFWSERWEDQGEGDNFENGPETTKYVCSGRCNDNNMMDYALGEDGGTMESFAEEMIDSMTTERKYEGLWSWIYENNVQARDSLEKEWTVKEVIVDLIGSLQTNIGCNNISLTATVEVERVGSFEYQELMATSKFQNVLLFKLCRSHGMLDLSSERVVQRIKEGFIINSRKEIYKGHIDPHKLNEDSLIKVFDVILENMPKLVWKMCRAEKYQNENTGNLNLVCRRQFTEEEWEKGIAFQHNNLRHWKEGYMVNKDDDGTEKT